MAAKRKSKVKWTPIKKKWTPKGDINGADANTLCWNSEPAVVGSAHGLLRTPGQRPLRIGSHCTGWATEGLALESMNIPHTHSFACDKERSVEILLRECFDIGIFFRDATHPDSVALAPEVDLYLNGWPCQPHSSMGDRRGPEDNRALLVDYMIQYLAQKLPRCFILENVASALEKRFKPWMDAIMETLRSLKESSGESAYEIFSTVCDSKDAGLPQRRKRLYIIGARKKFYGVTHNNPDFHWPYQVKPCTLESILDKNEDETLVMGDGATSDPSLMTTTVLRNLENVWKKMLEHDVDPTQYHIIVDIAASKTRQNFHIEGICPTITKQRGGCQGFFNTFVNRRLTVSEMIRLQGASPDRFVKGVSKIGSRAMGRICGNAMSPPVVQRILQNLLPSVGLVRFHDE